MHINYSIVEFRRQLMINPVDADYLSTCTINMYVITNHQHMLQVFTIAKYVKSLVTFSQTF